MAFTFKTTKEIEDAKKKQQQDEINLRNHKTYTPTTYTQSQELQDMWGKINNWETPTWNKEGNAWWQKLTDTMNAIENRKPFSYDLNGDMLYQQYKDQYTNLGNLAMMDTMGQATAITGGYGNSYAQSVGQQAYQGYLQQLNDKVPELYRLAYDQYNREEDSLYNKLSAYGNLYNTEYGEHRDEVSDSYADLANLTNLYGIKSDEEYNQWYNGEQLNMAANEQAYKKLADVYGISTEAAKTLYENAYKSQFDAYSTGYTEKRDQIADEQWQKNFDLAQAQLNETIRANKASEAAAWASANKPSSNTSLFGGFSEKEFTDAMRDAAERGSQKDAKALVTAAGNTDAAMEIYHSYFGEQDNGESHPNGEVSLGSGVYGQTIPLKELTFGFDPKTGKWK